MLRDFRYALRALWATPGFAAVAILSLALGTGANTAIFSLIDAVMLKSLPVSHPDELLQITMGGIEGYSNLVWEQLRDRQDVFQKIFASCGWHFNLASGGEVRNVNGSYVSGQYFEALGVHAVLGRTLTPADDRRGCPGVAVLSYGFWQREYGGRDVVGRAISLDNHPFQIAGITPLTFTGVNVGNTVDVFVPVCAEKIVHGDASLLDQRSAVGWLRVIGRPKPDVTAGQATARLRTLAPEIFKSTLPHNLRAEDRDVYLHRTLETHSAANGLSYLRDQYRLALMVLMVTSAVVLLIACANVANLLLARGATRQREIAIRMALGCGRIRLIRQLLTESLLLSFFGSALGFLFAKWGASLLVKYLDVSLDLAPDLRILAFTIGITFFTGLLFGIVPAWRGTRVDPQSAMKASSRGVIASAAFGPGKILVAAQVALSLVLVIGAGLMVSTFWKLVLLDPGFDRDHVLLTTVDLRNGHYPPELRLPAFRQMLEKVRTIPGVRFASASNFTPISMARWKHELIIDGYTARSRDDAAVYFNEVSEGFFDTLGIPIVAGRDFNSHETPASPPVAIINQTMARKYFGSANPLGKHYRTREGDHLTEPVEIVGIVKDSKYGTLREEIPPTAYISWSQDAVPYPLTNIEIRAAQGSPTALIAAVKPAVGEVNPNVSLEFITFAAQVNKTIERERLLAILSGFFGLLALLLATIGLYGVVSYNVARRRNEIGIRMALGAEQNRVMRMVLGEISILIGAGLTVGLAVAVATTRFVASFLYGLNPNDPLTLFLASSLLAAVAVFAGYFPARRASRVDPMTALREE